MKKQLVKLSALAVAVTLFSCSKDDPAPIITPVVIPTVTDAEMESDLKSDLTIDEVTDGLFSIFETSPAARGVELSEINLTAINPCDVTADAKLFDTYKGVSGYISGTFDYGTEGCTNERGQTVKGKVKYYYKESLPFAIEFTNYEVNSVSINGTVELTKTIVQGSDQPIIKNVQDLTVSIGNLGTLKRVGEITRKYIKGYKSDKGYTDDIFETTGSWKTTFPDDTTNEVVINKNLVTEMSCPVKKHKSGTATFTRNKNVAVIDFGDGTCAPEWTITRNGKTWKISRD